MSTEEAVGLNHADGVQGTPQFAGHIDEVRVTNNWARYGRTGKARMGRIAKGWKGVWVALKSAITGKPVPMEWEDFTIEAWVKPRNPDGIIDDACVHEVADGYHLLHEMREQWVVKLGSVLEVRSETRTVHRDGVRIIQTKTDNSTQGETP